MTDAGESVMTDAGGSVMTAAGESAVAAAATARRAVADPLGPAKSPPECAKRLNTPARFH